MIPLRNETPSRRFPLTVAALIALNGYVFFREVQSGSAIGQFIQRYALVPAAYVHPGVFTPASFARAQRPLFTALFLHGGIVHLLANMWYLWIFGGKVEGGFGRFRFLYFYVLCGLSGNAAHIVMNSRSTDPVLGASGCVAGVLGAYLVLFPGARITTVLPLGFIWTPVEIRAIFFIGIWFALQVLNGYGGMIAGGLPHPAVAWWAHIGGFLSGVVLTLWRFRRRRAR